MDLGPILLIAGGFLLGGAWSMWRMSAEDDDSRPAGRATAGPGATEARGRSAPQVVLAVVLLIAALLATASGILRLI
ncbi:hypothetical protein [Geodermatophilus sp. URMC 64]